MEAKFKFEKLIVWQEAMDLGENIQLLSESFPSRETFNLTSQSCRAADSIALNISEGSIAQSNPEQKRFIGYAIRSLAEVVTCLHKARRRNYIRVNEFERFYTQSFSLMNKLIAYKNSLR
ncbi:four helix bundle protein [Sinomicrobium sp. M5D2P17]